jgi:hypothetical protein
MKRNLRPSFLQISYLLIFIILFSLIVYTPTLIKGSVNVSPKIIVEEETVEGSLLCILFVMSILILKRYKYEVSKHKVIIKEINGEKKKVEDRLTDSEQYIGITNVQIQEIKYIFNSFDKYPESKEDLKRVFIFFGERALGIVNSKWILFRIIDKKTQHTIYEHLATRQGYSYSHPHVSNKMLIEKQPVFPFLYVSSNTRNINTLVICIVPVDKISNDQQIFIQAIVNEITKLFVIYNSLFYKKGDILTFEKISD